MKTKRQRQEEALQRREYDLKRITLERRVWNDLCKTGVKQLFAYDNVAILAQADAGDVTPEEWKSLASQFKRVVFHYDADAFFARKEAAATRDIESLRKKLG